ncbi:hypothetical protein [Aneurinibacillus aneurinilyticus]|jgi:4-hydroxybenzoate polyprenyltransferase|uniref:Uncharacterized protein n=2 Tax=Aneurinibacillus TaxID=55079 RepID=A0A0D1VGQ1_ANEMI|nr:hypothetical protein [Aneurinibacillus aneurinilyticus]KIV58614.1 hypothetical protein TS65_04240 [Aneurinibacillus migulanus]KON96297.1 hypothetical protein AF333_13230 [Aneurinibacillus migulanus]MCI1695562.1 hypothetical protein [Aneurinibacillus aneurinilyticus]NMF01162.1 hypothetical protein [Aneurinibacillus aneurinilyticus]SDI25667.1 hypothetical protein SAMN04487909_102296 [Aneurinibacillus migulanus]
MLYSFLITIVILVIQFFLSRRNNVYLGAILPVVYLVTLIYLWFSETLFIKSTLLAAFAGLAALLGIWINGRESLKKK